MTAITHLLKPRVKDLGGFSVRRLLPDFHVQSVGPFLFFDHMGPATLPPGEGMDVRPHLHIGLATVTYLFDGEILHRDSLGSVQAIKPGDVNWMTAGRGIAHSERTPAALRESGHRLHGIQTWVALPKASEEVAPSFHHHGAETLPRLQLGGADLHVIAGHAFGHTSPVKVYSDTLYVAVTMPAGSEFRVPAEHPERGVYVVEGDVSLDGEAIAPEHLAVLEPGRDVVLRAHGPARLMLLGGAPLDGQRFIWWNFVSSSKERIEKAKADWREERFEPVPGETERIPLPETRS